MTSTTVDMNISRCITIVPVIRKTLGIHLHEFLHIFFSDLTLINYLST